MFKLIKLKIKSFKSHINFKIANIKDNGLIPFLFKKEYLIINNLYNKYLESEDYESINYLPSLLNSSGIKLFIDKLLLKRAILNNLIKGYEHLVIVEKLYNKYPHTFNNSFIADLYIRTFGRIFYYLPENIKNKESLIMQIIIKEENYKKKNFPMYLFYKSKRLSLYELLDKDFSIKKELNQYILQKFYPKYIFLSSRLIRKKQIELFFKKEIIIPNEVLGRIYNKIIFKEDKIYFVKKLYEHKANKLAIKKFLENEYVYNYEILKDLNETLKINYIDINLENIHIYDSEQIKDIIEMYPNLSVYEENNYLNKNNFNKMLEMILKEYSIYDRNEDQLKWSIESNQLQNLMQIIRKKMSRYCISIENIIDETIMSNLLKIDAEYYCDYYFKNKYSTKMIDTVKKFPISKYSDSLIDNDIEKEIVLKDAYINDLEKMEEKTINYLINIKDEIFLSVCKDFLENINIANNRKEKILIKNPKISSSTNLSSIFSILELKNLIDKNDKIYKYCDMRTKENSELALLAINKNIENIKYIPKAYFYSKNFLIEVLQCNKRCLDTILKIMSNIKNSKFEDIEDYILNEYLRSENDKYLKYLSEEIIETYLILNKLNKDEIVDKKSLKKVNNIYINLKNEGII